MMNLSYGEHVPFIALTLNMKVGTLYRAAGLQSTCVELVSECVAFRVPKFLGLYPASLALNSVSRNGG